MKLWEPRTCTFTKEAMNSMSNENATCIQVDYTDSTQMSHLLFMLNAYSMDPMANKKPLSDEILNELKKNLPHVVGAISFLAYLNNDQSNPVGLINCFSSYSTFRARPLLNIHDIIVLPEHRGKNIGNTLIETVAAKAKELGFCKLSLEVRTDNPAERLYRRLGFNNGNHPMLFLTRDL